MINLRLLEDEPIIIKKNTKNIIAGHSVCLTGKIPGLTRIQATHKLELIEKVHYVHDILTKNTDYLIIGVNPGEAKLTKARKYNIRIISYTTIESLK